MKTFFSVILALGLCSFTTPVKKSNKKPPNYKKVVIVIAVSTPFATCATAYPSPVAGAITNCAPGPGEREVPFLVDANVGLDMSFNSHCSLPPSGKTYKVTIQGAGAPITAATGITSEPVYWSGNVPIDPVFSVTRIGIVWTAM